MNARILVLRAAPTDLVRLAAARTTTKAVAFMGTPPTEKRAYAAASPITHVSRSMPPVLLAHGDADQTVPFSQSAAMEAALKAVGVPVKLIRLPGGGHGPTFGVTGTPPTSWPDHHAEAAKWLDQELKIAKARASK